MRARPAASGTCASRTSTRRARCPGPRTRSCARSTRLGLAWDGPVVRQGERTARYDAALDRLRDRGLIYRCRCSRREIADSGVHGIDGIVYPGTCREAAVVAGNAGRGPLSGRTRARGLRRPRPGAHRAEPRARHRRLRGPPPRRALRLPARGRDRRRGPRGDRRGARCRPPRFHAPAGGAAARPGPAHAPLPALPGRGAQRREALQADARPGHRRALGAGRPARRPSTSSGRCRRSPGRPPRCSRKPPGAGTRRAYPAAAPAK